MLLVGVMGGLLGLAFFSPQEAEHVALALIESRSIGRGLTTFLIVPTIAVLAHTGKVTGEAAIAALSAIAGYMLASAGNVAPPQ